MRLVEKELVIKDMTGFFVELEMGAGQTFQYGLQLISPYRIVVQIQLPPDMEKLWNNGITQVLQRVENGCAWSLRFDYNNVLRFLSLEDLKQIEKKLPGVTIYVYNAPSQKSSFTEEALRRWHNAALREAYVNGSRPRKVDQMANTS